MANPFVAQDIIASRLIDAPCASGHVQTNRKNGAGARIRIQSSKLFYIVLFTVIRIVVTKTCSD